jgi:hypothetical protein
MKNGIAGVNATGRVRPFLLGVLVVFLPSASALAEVVNGDLTVNGSVRIGTDCTETTFPFDALRIHGSEPRLSLIDRSADGTDRDWSIGISDGDTGGLTDFFVRDEVSGAQVLRMTTNGAVALGAGAELVSGAISVGAMGNERRVARVADAVEDTDAVNKRQFDAFQADVLASVGKDANEFETELQKINDRIDDLARRVERLTREMQ